MSGDIESIGAAVTAGLAGHAVEPRHGGGASGAPGSRCLNCGTGLAGSHCHRCGQKADVHRSFGAIGHDLVHAIFHFEGKIWNTLPLLAWRPGDLTRRYIHGERARFISPLALFLFAVFLTYAVLAIVGATPRGEMSILDVQEISIQQREASALRNQLKRELDSVDARLASPSLSSTEKESAEADRHMLIGTARILKMVDTARNPDQISNAGTGQIRMFGFKTGIAAIDKAIDKANANPGLVFYKVQANAYKFAWALIPLSLPFLWLLYPFSRRFRTYDHFVFVTYSISFMLLLFVVVRLFNLTILGDLATFFAMLYAPFHMYRQLRGAYRSSRFGALVRAMFLLFFSLFTVTAFVVLLFAMGIMG
ncbi:MAG TPA: DUF3667 domain-containing protein [Sphingopyxis sp.]|nr:DUF3667 domain-containing protein [Sphingopyxis sp.]HMP46827.1 DUF3667 domain-containing protein [Sphingopyxis sp.]HMQ18823.1 DUF3667 domain-containing protein [Sphingopyxis sp.]